MSDLKIFTDNIEPTALNQIYTLVKQPAFADCKVRIMPDVHAGAGCVIGFTADLGDKVIPNIVGVDIGCGMLTVELGKIDIDFDYLDKAIRENVPSGREVNETAIYPTEVIEYIRCYKALKDPERLVRSIGSLGGGNHFIEIIGIGKGNEDWNCSAPHGAGRIMSRSKAKELVSLEEYEDSMKGIFTTSVSRSTIDESPMAYKTMEEIIANIADTVEVVNIIKPVYNFKASE